MSDKRKKINYTDDDVLQAVASIENGLSFRKASLQYGVPVMTISDKYRKKTPLVNCKPGPQTFLSEHQEQQLVKFLSHSSKIGYGVERKAVRDIVKNILDTAEKDGYVIDPEKKFQGNKPSICWVYRFLQRHPELSARTPENLGFQRAYVTETSIRKWFDNLEKFLLDEHGISASQFLVEGNGHRVFNLDESGFPLQGTNGKLKIIAERGSRSVYRLASDNKTQITILACASAAGTFSKPLVIYPGLKTPKFNFNGINEEDYDVGFTPNG